MNDYGGTVVRLDAALLIDWENLKYSLENRGHRVSISALRDAAEKHGRLVIARAYADWQEHAGDAGNLYASGIEPVFVPVRRQIDADDRARVKNSVDVKLTADCIELIHRFPTISTYILVSGDQDFIHVVNTLRPYGKRTVLIGVSWTTSVRLAEQVDEMVYYDSDVDPLLPDVALTPISPELGEPTLPPSESKPDFDEAAEFVLVSNGNEATAASIRSMARLVAVIVEVTSEYRSSSPPRPLLLSQLGLEVSRRAVKPITFTIGGNNHELAHDGCSHRWSFSRLTPGLQPLWTKATTDIVNQGVNQAIQASCYQEGWTAGSYRLSMTPSDDSPACRSFFQLGLEDGRAGRFEPPK